MKPRRTIIIFDEAMWQRAKLRAVREGLSLAALVRKGMGEYLDKKPKGRKEK